MDADAIEMLRSNQRSPPPVESDQGERLVTHDERSLSFWSEVVVGATEESIQNAESYVGQRLPDSLRTLLKVQDGGVSNYGACVSQGERYPVLPLLGVSATASGSIVRAFDLMDSFDVPREVVVFAAMGNAWLGLDYRSGPVPSVLYGDVDYATTNTIAENFDEFLKNLVEA